MAGLSILQSVGKIIFAALALPQPYFLALAEGRSAIELKDIKEDNPRKRFVRGHISLPSKRKASGDDFFRPPHPMITFFGVKFCRSRQLPRLPIQNLDLYLSDIH